MSHTHLFKRRSFQVLLGLIGLTVILFTLLAATPFTPGLESNQGGLDPRIQKIMNETPFRHGEWGLLESDPATRRVVNTLGPAQRFYVPGSTAKLFSVSAALGTLGFDHHLTTPVYALGHKNGNTLNGTLVLVSQGDLTMGGRTKPDGTVDYTDLDHTDANVGLGATLTPEDPLAGIKQLAQQVRASGITHVSGDVVIDDRLFQPDPSFAPTIPDPIIINDNLIDVVVTPGQVGGGPKSVMWRPQVAPYHLDVQVKTVAAGQPTTITVQTFPDGRVLVRGDIAADVESLLRVSSIIDPAAFARTALIEALRHIGVTVSSEATGPNPVSKLPANGTYQGDPRVAAYISPPFREYAKLILKVSHNLGANLTVCLMAVYASSTNCDDGFPVMASFLDHTHIDRSQVVQSDGRGNDPADHFTPQAAIELLNYWLGRPEAMTFRLMLPIMGVDGSLAFVCPNCPARGKVFAKTGTVLRGDSLNARVYQDQSYAGYIEVRPGVFYTYDLVVNGAVVPDVPSALKVYDELGAISAYLQEDAAG